MEPNKESVEKIHQHLIKAREALDDTYKRDFDEVFHRLVSAGMPAEDIDYVLGKYIEEYQLVRGRIEGMIARTDLVLEHIEVMEGWKEFTEEFDVIRKEGEEDA